VQRPAGGEELLGKGVDRGRIEQVYRPDLDVDSRQRGRGLAEIAGRDDDLGAGGTQHPRGLPPEARVAAGDDCDPAGQVDAVDDLGRRGSGTEAGTDGILQRGHRAHLLKLTCSRQVYARPSGL
jgi:hypothetical protein